MAELRKLDHDPFSAIKEVMETDKINARTDLDIKQIQCVTDQRTLNYVFDSKLGDRHISDFLTTTLSKDRKSRAELMDSIKTTLSKFIEDVKFKLTG